MPQYSEERKEEIFRYWVNNPLLTYEQIAKDCKVASKTFYLWRRDEQFMERYHQLCEERFKTLEAQAIEKLSDQVREGNWNAVRYVLDNRGFGAAQKIDVNTPTVITVSIEE